MPTSLAGRLWAKVDVSGSCWLWDGHRFRNGYGAIRESSGPRRLLAHRVSWEIANGPIPPGFVVLHSCDVRACVRPDHLRLGRQRDNIRDMDTKGRRRTQPSHGERNGGAELTLEQVRSIRERRRRGEGVAALAAAYGMSLAAVSLIVRGRTWRQDLETVR